MEDPREILWKSSKKCCLDAVELAGKSEEFYIELLKLSMSEEEPFAHRAGWSMVHLAQRHPSRVRPSLREIASGLKHLPTHSQVGSFLRVFDTVIFDLEEFGELLDFALHTIRMPQKAEYVKSIALNVILKFGKTYPELIPELIEEITLSKETIEMTHVKKKAEKILKEFESLINNQRSTI